MRFMLLLGLCSVIAVSSLNAMPPKKSHQPSYSQLTIKHININAMSLFVQTADALEKGSTTNASILLVIKELLKNQPTPETTENEVIVGAAKIFRETYAFDQNSAELEKKLEIWKKHNN